MYRKNLKPFFPPGSRNIILIFLVIGIGAFFYGFDKDTSISILGLIIFLLSVFIVTGQYGVQINFNNRRYRTYLSFIYIIKFGSWKDLPEIKEILLTPAKHFMSKSSMRNNIYTETFYIKLIGQDEREPISVSRGLYGELMLEAEELSKKLNVPVKEY
jgi:hypothetical protein